MMFAEHFMWRKHTSSMRGNKFSFHLIPLWFLTKGSGQSKESAFSNHILHTTAFFCICADIYKVLSYTLICFIFIIIMRALFFS